MLWRHADHDEEYDEEYNDDDDHDESDDDGGDDDDDGVCSWSDLAKPLGSDLAEPLVSLTQLLLPSLFVCFDCLPVCLLKIRYESWIIAVIRY